MEITWEVEGAMGDRGNPRTFRLEIDEADLADYPDRVLRERYIDEVVREDFLSKIGYTWEVTGAGQA